MEYKTDSQSSHCLFCYRTTKTESEFSTKEINNKFKFHKKFFALITRQLLNNISANGISKSEKQWCRNHLQIISRSIKNTNENESFGILKVSRFCKKCEKIVYQFCKLYHQIEKLKLQLDWKISKLSKVIRSADRKNLINQCSINLLDNGVDELLRKETRKILKQSFITYHKIQKATSFPRVQLSSILMKHEEEDRVPIVFDPISLEELSVNQEALESDTHQVELVNSNVGSIKTENNTFATEDNSIPLTDTSPSSSSTVPSNQNNEIPIIDVSLSPQPLVQAEDSLLVLESLSTFPKNFKCSLCSYSSKLESNLFRHEILFHPDKQFNSVKLKNVSNEHFKNCIVNLLEKIVIYGGKVDSDSEFLCMFCASKFSGKDEVKVHLALNHTTILKEKLFQLQKSGRMCLISIFIPKKPVQIEYTCLVCSTVFQKRFCLKRHQCLAHPEVYFYDYKKPTIDNQVFQTKIISLINEGFSTNFPQIKDKKGRLRVKLKCNHCERTFINSGGVKYHIVSTHKQIIANKLKNWFGSGYTEVEIDLEILETRTLTITSSSSSVTVNKKTYVCPACEKIFAECYSLNQHQSFEHPELFFESSNLFWKSESTTCFKMFVDHFLVQETCQRFTKVTNSCFGKEHVKFKCKICSSLLFNLRLAKIHLVLRHRKLMAGKLENLQTGEKTKHNIEMELKNVQKAMPKRQDNNIRVISFSEHIFCQLCSKTFSRRSALNMHIALKHPAQFFEGTKSTFLTLDQFSNCVEKMLSEELENFHKSVDEVYGTVKWQCSYCPRWIIGNNKESVKRHVLTNHVDELREKLKQIQEAWKN